MESAFDERCIAKYAENFVSAELNLKQEHYWKTKEDFQDILRLCEPKRVRVDGLQSEIGRLKSALSAKDKEIVWMRDVIKDLAESKTELAINSNRCMDQMREYLLH